MTLEFELNRSMLKNGAATCGVMQITASHIQGHLSDIDKEEHSPLAAVNVLVGSMVHRSEKAIRYEKELDEARLRGHFHLVPNLARKLQKHDHHKQCIIHAAQQPCEYRRADCQVSQRQPYARRC